MLKTFVEKALMPDWVEGLSKVNEGTIEELSSAGCLSVLVNKCSEDKNVVTGAGMSTKANLLLIYDTFIIQKSDQTGVEDATEGFS